MDEQQTPSTRAPDEIDIALGGRLRHHRVLIGLTQERLGEKLGLTFQQVQKYERGHNRVPFGRFIAMARALEVAPATLIDEVCGPIDGKPVLKFDDDETIKLAAAFAGLTPGRRRAVLALVRELSMHQPRGAIE